MRYAILSDVHANFQAWEAVASDISDSGITFTVSLGDIVGYGPRPADTLKAVHDSADNFVIGNHDAAVAGVFDDSIFTEDARSIVQWSRKEIQGSSEWFLCQPHVLTIDCGAYCAICTHGSMHEPDDFNYVLSKEDALDCWNSCDEQVVFVGHTHEPCVHELSENGIYRKHQPFDFIPIPGKEYIGNVGRVQLGQTCLEIIPIAVANIGGNYVRHRPRHHSYPPIPSIRRGQAILLICRGGLDWCAPPRRD